MYRSYDVNDLELYKETPFKKEIDALNNKKWSDEEYNIKLEEIKINNIKKVNYSGT